jgi:hypothetical protein
VESLGLWKCYDGCWSGHDGLIGLSVAWKMKMVQKAT